jgi:hypothetical protein
MWRCVVWNVVKIWWVTSWFIPVRCCPLWSDIVYCSQRVFFPWVNLAMGSSTIARVRVPCPIIHVQRPMMTQQKWTNVFIFLQGRKVMPLPPFYPLGNTNQRIGRSIYILLSYSGLVNLYDCSPCIRNVDSSEDESIWSQQSFTGGLFCSWQLHPTCGGQMTSFPILAWHERSMLEADF